jgi:hypothetical protein
LRRYSESKTETIPWSMIEREVSRLEDDKKAIEVPLSALLDKIDAEERHVLRTRSIVETIDELASANLDDAGFDDKVRIIRDLGLDVKVSWRMWALNWSVPVGQAVERDFAARINLTGIDAVSGDDSVRRDVQAVTQACTQRHKLVWMTTERDTGTARQRAA